MRTVPATEFKARCLELMDRVAERRESFLITKRGKPVARLVPVEPQPKDSIFGWLRGQAWEVGNVPFRAVPPEAWEVLKEWDELNAPDSHPRRRSTKAPMRRRR